MDHYLQFEDALALGQASDYTPLDDLEGGGAHFGPKMNGIKSETPADTVMGIQLQDLNRSPMDGFLEMEWMEQDVALPDNLFNDLSIWSLPPITQDDNQVIKPPSIDPPSTIITSAISPGVPDGEVKKELGEGHVFADEFLNSLDLECSLKRETPSPSSSLRNTMPEIQVTPEIVLSVAEADESALQVLQGGQLEFIQSPLSPDDVENLLSSANSLASSPAPTPSPGPTVPSPAPSPASTVDISILSTDGDSFSFNTSDLYKVVENTEARPTPYSRPTKATSTSKTPKTKQGRRQTASISPKPSELELELMSKKDRKKLQNKNAAIRYRMKKKAESEVKKTEVDELEEINNGLQDQCDSLQQQVTFMKNLINDIRKEKGLPALSLTQEAVLALGKK